MQPSLGGAEDLRGYRPYRFRGDNLLAMNAEYRWEVFSGLDMAVFARRRQGLHAASRICRCRDLESDVGFGFRFNAAGQDLPAAGCRFQPRRISGLGEVQQRVQEGSGSHFQQHGGFLRCERFPSNRSRQLIAAGLLALGARRGGNPGGQARSSTRTIRSGACPGRCRWSTPPAGS